MVQLRLERLGLHTKKGVTESEGCDTTMARLSQCVFDTASSLWVVSFHPYPTNVVDSESWGWGWPWLLDSRLGLQLFQISTGKCNMGKEKIWEISAFSFKIRSFSQKF